MPANRPYALLARYYDEFFTSHIPEYQRARRELLQEILPEVHSACDLACGTGTTAIELARRGIKVFAVDLSPTMCRLARSKARSAGVHMVVILGDMRTFSLPERVDLVSCEYDAVNHLPRKSDLGRTARAVARALRPGGYFYFDVNNRRHLEKNWPGTHWLERPGGVMVMRGRYDRGRTKGRGAFARTFNNWCSRDADIEIDLLSDKRIEGIGIASEKFNCKKCEPEGKAEEKPFTWIPK